MLIERTRIIPKEFTQPTRLFGRDDTTLPQDVVSRAASSLNITPSQVALVFNIWKLGQLEKLIRETAKKLPISEVNQKVTSLEKSYKRVVKKDLLNTIREDEDDLGFNTLGVREQSAHLEKLFNGAIVRYRATLR